MTTLDRLIPADNEQMFIFQIHMRERDRTRSVKNIRGQHRYHVSVRIRWACNSWTTCYQPEKGMVWCVTIVRLPEISVNLGGILTGVSAPGRFNQVGQVWGGGAEGT